MTSPEIGTGETESVTMYGDPYNTDMMRTVDQLYDAFDEVNSYDDLNETEQEALNGIQQHLDTLHDSAKSREELSKIRWDRIEDNANGMVGEIEETIGLPDDFNADTIPDNGYSECVQTIEYNVSRIVESLQIIEENAQELNEATQ